MGRLFWISKFKKSVDSFKGFGLGSISFKYLFARVFFCKVVYVAAALTILMPCFIEPIFVNATEMIAEDENGLLVSANSIKKNITTPFGSLDTGSINKEPPIEKLNFFPESVSKLLSSFIKTVSSFSAFAEDMGKPRSNDCNCGTTDKSNNSVGHLYIAFTLGFGFTALVIVYIVRPLSTYLIERIANRFYNY
jgi:predicted PurR-regulated permease PerM